MKLIREEKMDHFDQQRKLHVPTKKKHKNKQKCRRCISNASSTKEMLDEI